jgi:hypothetical protein
LPPKRSFYRKKICKSIRGYLCENISDGKVSADTFPNFFPVRKTLP